METDEIENLDNKQLDHVYLVGAAGELFEKWQWDEL